MKKNFSILLVITILLTPTAINADTVIKNSVSVNANGGVSTTKIKTVHNGEVIEDINISTTTPFHYQSNYDSDDEVKSTVKTRATVEEDDRITQLKSLIKELQKLMALYEKLLAIQNVQ